MLKIQRFRGSGVTPNSMNPQHSRGKSHINSRSLVRRIGSVIASSALLAGGLVAVTTAPAQAVANFTNKTTANGLGDNIVLGVYTEGMNVYAATEGGLAISTDGGESFTNRTTANGLGGNNVFGVFAVGANVYAATSNDYGGVGGLSISTNGGATFTNYTAFPGSNAVRSVYVVGSTIYAATDAGLAISNNGGTTVTNIFAGQGYGVYAVAGSPYNTVYFATHSNGLFISTDGGGSFTLYDDNDGLGENDVNGVFAVGSTIYAATVRGLSISTDISATPPFVNYNVANGLVNRFVNGVHAVGTTVYAATEGGLSITTDGGATFTNYTTANGLGNNRVRAVYAVGGTIYAATNGGLSISYGGGSEPVVSNSPPPWLQSYGRAQQETCQIGWHASWAEWAVPTSGGWVCNRTIFWNGTAWVQNPNFVWGLMDPSETRARDGN